MCILYLMSVFVDNLLHVLPTRLDSNNGGMWVCDVQMFTQTKLVAFQLLMYKPMWNH